MNRNHPGIVAAVAMLKQLDDDKLRRYHSLCMQIADHPRSNIGRSAGRHLDARKPSNTPVTIRAQAAAIGSLPLIVEEMIRRGMSV